MAPHLAPQAHEASRGRAALQSVKKQCGADTGTVTTTTGLLPPNKHLVSSIFWRSRSLRFIYTSLIFLQRYLHMKKRICGQGKEFQYWKPSGFLCSLILMHECMTSKRETELMKCNSKAMGSCLFLPDLSLVAVKKYSSEGSSVTCHQGTC